MVAKTYSSRKKTMKKKYNKKKSNVSRNRKTLSKSSKKKKRKYTRKAKHQSGGNPITHIMRQGQFGFTRLVDMFRGNPTPIRYNPNVTSQFGHKA